MNISLNGAHDVGLCLLVCKTCTIEIGLDPLYVEMHLNDLATAQRWAPAAFQNITHHRQVGGMHPKTTEVVPNFNSASSWSLTKWQ